MHGTRSRSMCPGIEGHVKVNVKVKMNFCRDAEGNLYNSALLNVLMYIFHDDLWFRSATIFGIRRIRLDIISKVQMYIILLMIIYKDMSGIHVQKSILLFFSV